MCMLRDDLRSIRKKKKNVERRANMLASTEFEANPSPLTYILEPKI